MKTTNEYAWDFCQMQGYISIVSKATNLPIVNLERDCHYAFTITGKRLKDVIEVLQAEQERRVKFLKSICDEVNGNFVPRAQYKDEFDVFVAKWEEDWKALLAKPLEFEPYRCQLSDVPKTLNLPDQFWSVLSEIIEDPVTAKEKQKY